MSVFNHPPKNSRYGQGKLRRNIHLFGFSISLSSAIKSFRYKLVMINQKRNRGELCLVLFKFLARFFFSMALLLIVIAVLNVYHFDEYFSRSQRQVKGQPCDIATSKGLGRQRHDHGTLPNNEFLQQNQFDGEYVRNSAHNLVIVAGHAVVMAEDLSDADHDENIWYLLDYQKHKGLPHAFVSHIHKGIQIAAADPHSLLIFSGGQTRRSAGPRSESSGYYLVADHYSWWNMSKSVRVRATTEEYARDSFENLLFSICRFREITGRFPDQVTLLSFTFKRERFEKYHRRALRFPLNRFSFVGVDPPASTGFDMQKLSYWEKKAALKPFQNDMYGCRSKELVQKREERNPFFRTPSYELTCPEIKGLLSWCGPGIYSGKLPWTS